MSDTKTSAIFVIAAIAVIIFSAVGVGVMTGIIPSSMSRTSDPQATAQPDQPDTVASGTSSAKQGTSAMPKQAPITESAKRNTRQPVRVASAPPACPSCGTVEAVNVIEQKGEGSGLGAVAGGVIGGVLGNQVGAGRGRTAATVVGAGAGAYAGHEIEKQVKKTQRYDVVVRLEDGTSRTFPYDSQPPFRTGDRVRIVDGTLSAN